MLPLLARKKTSVLSDFFAPSPVFLASPLTQKPITFCVSEHSFFFLNEEKSSSRTVRNTSHYCQEMDTYRAAKKMALSLLPSVSSLMSIRKYLIFFATTFLHRCRYNSMETASVDLFLVDLFTIDLASFDLCADWTYGHLIFCTIDLYDLWPHDSWSCWPLAFSTFGLVTIDFSTIDLLFSWSFWSVDLFTFDSFTIDLFAFWPFCPLIFLPADLFTIDLFNKWSSENSEPKWLIWQYLNAI